MTEATNQLSDIARLHLQVFRKSFLLRAKLREIMRMLGPVEGLTCLDVGAPNGMISYHLRRHGGTWYSAVEDNAVDSMRAVIGDSVHPMEAGRLPFKEKSFDVVVIVDYLERASSDMKFIEECHRVLKPDGRLVCNVARPKSFTLINPVKRLLGVDPESCGMQRPGYTESMLFRLLKDGFDVQTMRSYSRSLCEFVDTLVRSFAGGPESVDIDEHEVRVRSVAYPFLWVAYQLDMLLFFSRGYYLVASAKRRGWHPRKAPVLVDGRSISEAVLSRAEA
jgi:ubiquinone/menaquinone biosynthesis C-methylase UbiE